MDLNDLFEYTKYIAINKYHKNITLFMKIISFLALKTIIIAMNKCIIIVMIH